MSSTEIVIFNKNGNAVYYDEVKNSHRGANAIWRFLEEKYLPIFRPSFVPKYIKDEELETYLGYKPSRDIPNSNFGNHIENMQEIWDLFYSKELTINEKIVIGTTFDRILVKKENLKKVIEAFNSFEGETSLKEQAKILETILNKEDVIAVGWNQTSINRNHWTDIYDPESEEAIPYNCLEGDNHFWLFNELKVKEYEVKLHIKDYENLPTVLTIETTGKEHPGKKAMEFYAKNGWNVDLYELRVDKIRRIY